MKTTFGTLAVSGRRQVSRKPEKVMFSIGRRPRDGFTLMELMVAMLVGAIAIGAVYSVYLTQQRQYRTQRLMVAVQQNLRGAMVVMAQQIRMAGYDPEESGRFGITDVRRYDLVDSRPNPEGEPALFYSMDLDENGAPDARGHRHVNGDPYNREFANFRIRDDRDIGRRYLAWDNGGGRRQLAENIVCMGLAYAIDADGDGRRDTWKGGSHPIWAVDADNDNLLDTRLDANNDGCIDERDDTDNDQRITAADGGRLNPPVSLSRIRAVRIWLLAQSAPADQRHVDHRVYVVGDRIMPPCKDGSMRRIMETVIECRNL